MGTTWSIKYHAAGKNAPSPENVRQRAEAALAEVNRQMSTYLKDSELTQFNRSTAGHWFAVSSATARVVHRAIAIHQQTDGALDVTLAPLVRLWDFGPGKKVPFEPPSQASIEQAIRTCGIEKLACRLQPPALRKEVDQLEVDLSSIAKGHGVDVVVEVLSALNIENCMVEVGGEIRCQGLRADGQPWQIGVESPQPGKQSLTQIISLRDLAMATSGDYRNFRERDGVAYSHILNPQTGQPLKYRGFAVTVLAKSCVKADALATALVVMGEEVGMQWCEEHHVAAMFQVRQPGKQPLVRKTLAFRQLTGESNTVPSEN